jgi:hypothetical protein
MPDEIEPFQPAPSTQAEYVRAIWQDMKVVKAEVKITNGRVTRIERVLVLGGGVVVGIGIGYGVLNLSALLTLL